MPGQGPGSGPAPFGSPFTQGQPDTSVGAPQPPAEPPGHIAPASAFPERFRPHTPSWTVTEGTVSLPGGTAAGVSTVTGNIPTAAGPVLTTLGELPYFDIVVSFDDAHIYNDVRVTRLGGTTQFATDATSQANYLVRTFDRTGVQTQSDSDSLYTAQYIRGRYKDPILRFDRIVVHPRRLPNVEWTPVLGLELLTHINVKRRPQGIGSAISQDCLIEGIQIDGTPDNISFAFQLSPGPPSGWLLGDPIYGVLGSTTRLFA
jgi:hypothetical protein